MESEKSEDLPRLVIDDIISDLHHQLAPNDNDQESCVESPASKNRNGNNIALSHRTMEVIL